MEKEDKIRLIENGDLARFKDFKRKEYKEGRLTSDRMTQMSFSQYLKKTNKDYYCCNCMEESRRKKKIRVRKKITDLIAEGTALFLTMTFSDSVFEKTSKETRRRYVSRYLKKYSTNYVANIDFGENNGREHYHAIVDGVNDVDFKQWYSKYGAINMRHINSNDKQDVILSRYITKLTLHAVKNSTGNERIIYSRETNDL